MSVPVDRFAPFFRGRRVIPAEESDWMSEIYALRFDVYCTECEFLAADAFPDRRERDRHDVASAHFCATNLEGLLAGYVRLVPPDARGQLPFEDHCPGLFDGVVLPDPGKSAEISRLMVNSQYRRRRGDTLGGVTAGDDRAPAIERRNDSPQIMLSLFRQMYAYSVANDVRYWYAAMERTLARALVRLGFAFRQIGPETDYYGPVAPYLADLRDLESNVGAAKPDLLVWMQDALVTTPLAETTEQ